MSGDILNMHKASVSFQDSQDGGEFQWTKSVTERDSHNGASTSERQGRMKSSLSVPKKKPRMDPGGDRLYHTIERYDANFGLHPHPGELDNFNTEPSFESSDSLELCQLRKYGVSLPPSSCSELGKDVEIILHDQELISTANPSFDLDSSMHCVTPAPSQFEDLPVDASANMKRAENAVISDQLSSEIESDKKYLAEEARTINGLTFCQDYNSCNKSPAKGSIIRNRKSFNERDIDHSNKNIYLERQ